MANMSNISKINHTVLLGLGILTICTILFGQVYTTQFTSSEEIKTYQESSSNTDAQQQIIVKVVDAIATTTHASLIHSFYFIKEIIHTKKNHEENSRFALPKCNTLFTVLFRQIISPNAP